MVEHARVHELTAAELERARSLLERWADEPTW
jgi:hypothetical protein